MNDFIFKDNFVDFMKSNINGIKEASGGKELVTHCKYCSDAYDTGNGHMYIKVPQSDKDVALFYCFKCQSSGIIDSKRLSEWGIFNNNFGNELDRYNSIAIKKSRGKVYSREWFTFINRISNFDLASTKLDYINNRLGLSLSFEDCLRDKIILNLKDGLDYNRVPYTRHPSIVEQLNDNFVGFLSLDNNFVNLRRLCPEGRIYHTIDKRYINYNIFGKQDNTEKMYILPVSIDLSNGNRIPIHIAEGPFDILSIKYNLRKDVNGIFAAVTGSGYKGLLWHILNTFQIYYFDLHIYPDNDTYGDKYIMRDLYNIVKVYNASMYEHRNIYHNEKDFGVHHSHIKESVIKL